MATWTTRIINQFESELSSDVKLRDELRPGVNDHIYEIQQEINSGIVYDNLQLLRTPEMLCIVNHSNSGFMVINCIFNINDEIHTCSTKKTYNYGDIIDPNYFYDIY